MSTPYIGEIRMFGFSRIPVGWFACDGSPVSISQNQALFALIGTTYGGDGVTNFCVPDLRGRVPIHQGMAPGLSPRPLGQTGGAETVTLLPNHLPQHSHALVATSAPATTDTPGTGVLHAAQATDTTYMSATPDIPLASTAIGINGSTQPHNNLMPTLSVNYCICSAGVFPSRN